MNKKCTLLAAAVFMVAGAFTAHADVVTSAQPVDADGWTAGNYYLLQTGGTKYLSLSGDKSDSVIVKTFDATPAKAAIDSALWQITNAGTTPAGIVYQFKNKTTQTVLSFAAQAGAEPVIAAGINQWTFDNGVIKAYYGNGQSLALDVSGDDLSLGTTGTTDFKVYAPDSAMVLTATEMGNGFSVFQLTFGETYQGDIFSGKDLLAKQVTGQDVMTLQVKGDETYPDGVAKYLGVDTLKTAIAGQQNVFGATFTIDSTRTVVRPNALCQQFKFTIDLKNDSLAMYVAGAPDVNGDLSVGTATTDTVRVVYASVASAKVLTVSKYDASKGNAPLQGAAPLITVKKGTPSAIATGTGVYYLQNAGKNGGGKYFVSSKNTEPLMGADSLSVFQAKGQWYVLENDGKYSIGSRYDGSDFGMNKEVFPVQGMANTYTISGRTDSITFVYQKDVNFDNKFLGVLHFSDSEIADNGYQLSAVADIGVGNLPVFTTDTMLRAKAGSPETPIAFKVAIVEDSIPNATVNTGATSLGDKLYTATYKLLQQFTNDSVANNAEPNNTGLVLTSTAGKALTFTFVTALEGSKYKMQTAGPEFVSLDINNANLVLSDKVAYFDFTTVDAPEYASFDNSHRLLISNGKYLTMNPLNFFAEMKNEGQGILKADYEADNFSLWVEKVDTVIPGKTLYYISTALHLPETKAETDGRYYLVSLRDSNETVTDNNVTYYRAGFIVNDTIKTMKNSPALFAFKTMEDGGYQLENQRELNRDISGGGFRTPYIGMVNNVVVMSNVGVPFTVETTDAPTSNEDINVSEVVITGGNDQVTVYNAAGKKITVTNILGQNIATVIATSDNFSIPSEKGIIVVAVDGGDAQKVVVK
ncbi:DUF6383 domain-containing protein [Parabacteroides bouchesdurhonensis]|uniref:DUF6383 domain-containing protein n=1 Tax=Parabacteroides bouchesdurhonensis TaxID=1936995 RepID=UPI000E4C508B|nr:DUF6383 domain-containing protein [Parabacteroides bouchesdurhonensis]RHJ93672.1 hypothetical protein DW095_05355 [Bacteroides sp. AM07-16]